jgi:hypothetical protein
MPTYWRHGELEDFDTVGKGGEMRKSVAYDVQTEVYDLIRDDLLKEIIEEVGGMRSINNPRETLADMRYDNGLTDVINHLKNKLEKEGEDGR